MKISVVIPIHNNFGLLHQTLWDLYKHCSNLYEIIVVDDASTEKGFKKFLLWWKENIPIPLKEIWLEKNVGFLSASNEGLKEASGDAIILLSNDVRIYKDIAMEISIYLTAFPKSLIGGTIYTRDTGWNSFGGKIFPYVEGYCLVTTKDGWKELGYFDELYKPNDFEDVDLSTTAESLGYQLRQLPEGMVNHVGSQSIPYGAERETLTKKNREKFREKWIK